MDHPFRIGQRYRNRNGEYEVLQIEGPLIVIRYLDGPIIKSSVALQARIWEQLQEGDEGEFDYKDDADSGESRKTEDIRLFVEQVLQTLEKPWPPDITDRICLAIEQKPDWLSYYKKLVEEFGELTVNSGIGYYVRELTGMGNTGHMATSKSQLIKSYSVLTANR